MGFHKGFGQKYLHLRRNWPVGAGSVHHAAIKPFISTSISSINVEKQSGMKRSNDGQPDVRGGDLRTSVPVVFSPYKLCFSLFANINDCRPPRQWALRPHHHRSVGRARHSQVTPQPRQSSCHRHCLDEDHVGNSLLQFIPGWHKVRKPTNWLHR